MEEFGAKPQSVWTWENDDMRVSWDPAYLQNTWNKQLDKRIRRSGAVLVALEINNKTCAELLVPDDLTFVHMASDTLSPIPFDSTLMLIMPYYEQPDNEPVVDAGFLTSIVRAGKDANRAVTALQIYKDLSNSYLAERFMDPGDSLRGVVLLDCWDCTPVMIKASAHCIY